jgi:hypothetical protein
MKRVTILNGITDDSYMDFEEQIELFKDTGNDIVRIDHFILRKMDIKYCTGCWSCWLKTPGECPQKDDMTSIYRSVINSDLTVFVSPVVMGFVSKYIKKVNDRLIPLVLPYITIIKNEMRHLRRYDKYPRLGLMLLDRPGSSGDNAGHVSARTPDDKADNEIITDIYKRLALNFQTDLAFSIANHGDMEVLKNEMLHI